ncbi:MAG TPA: hypothetical protein PK299_02730 [Anaerolineales bacterium]|nr:hypothetical protein [Anaerolineales bacterium]
MTEHESTTQESKNQSVAEKSKTFKSYVTILTVWGVLGVLAGLINLFGAMPSGFSGSGVSDAIFNTVFSILIFVCSRVLAKGKVLAIWLLIGCILFSIIYSFAMGRGINFVIAGLGAFYIWQLFVLKKQGELS